LLPFVLSPDIATNTEKQIKYLENKNTTKNSPSTVNDVKNGKQFSHTLADIYRQSYVDGPDNMKMFIIL